MGKKARPSAKYREVFFARNGEGPYPCFFCDGDVTFDEVVVHHVNDDPFDNTAMNLVAAHNTCHSSHHNAGKTVPQEVRDRIAAARKGSGPLTDDHRAKISAAHRGRKHTDEHRQRVSAAVKKWHNENGRGADARSHS